MSDLVLEDHFAFLHFLDCHYLLRFVVPAQSNFSEGSFPDDRKRSEILNRMLQPPANRIEDNWSTFVSEALPLFSRFPF